jgi:hypothetical protein
MACRAIAARRGGVLVEARQDLSAHSDAVAHCESLDAVSNHGHLAHDLVANDARVVGRTPTALDRVDVGAADAAVGDLDLHVLGAKRA